MRTRYAHTRIHSAEKKHFRTLARTHWRYAHKAALHGKTSRPRRSSAACIGRLSRLAKAATLLRCIGRHTPP